jgi:hypothetical protein
VTYLARCAAADWAGHALRQDQKYLPATECSVPFPLVLYCCGPVHESSIMCYGTVFLTCSGVATALLPLQHSQRAIFMSDLEVALSKMQQQQQTHVQQKPYQAQQYQQHHYQQQYTGSSSPMRRHHPSR